ncbi:hypothetical protein QBC39DRAFT_416126 [Podospora conica]|nr:hypothetical protein QBC39DRAFT_416126 [Schizothecium conicum]
MNQRIRPARLFLAIVALSLPCLSWSHVLSSECIRAQLILNTQSDIDVLAKCASYEDNPYIGHESFKGDVIIGPNIAGTFTLGDYGIINGSAIAENNPALEKIVFLEDSSPGQGFNTLVLRNLPQLKSFVLWRRLATLQSDILFQNLPMLEDLDLGYLAAVERIDLVDLPRLQFLEKPGADRESIPFGGRGPRHVNIDNVGFSSIQTFFESGMGGTDNPNTENSTYRVRGLPNVYNLTIGLVRAASVEIQGNGQLAMLFRCEVDCGLWGPQEVEFRNMSVSGLSELSRHWQIGTSNRSKNRELKSLQIGNFRAIANNFTSLGLDFEGLGGLYIVDNPKLETLLFRMDAAAQYEWTDIVITGNPLLKLNSTVATKSSNRTLTPGLIWPTKDVSSMVFEGSFDNAFLQHSQPFIDLGPDRTKRPRVLKKFSVTSSQPLNCSQLNELRKTGVLKGDKSRSEVDAMIVSLNEAVRASKALIAFETKKLDDLTNAINALEVVRMNIDPTIKVEDEAAPAHAFGAASLPENNNNNITTQSSQ